MASRSASGALRTIALVEGAKGTLVLVVGVGLLSLIHEDVQRVAEELVRHFHLNPARRYPRIFIHAAAEVTNGRLQTLAMAAFCYASMRFVEAYGMWRGRAWAQWFGIVSGAVYLPVEIYHLSRHITWAEAALFAVNVLIVGYLISIRRNSESDK